APADYLAYTAPVHPEGEEASGIFAAAAKKYQTMNDKSSDIDGPNVGASAGLEHTTALARIGLRMSDWFEKWFPDAFVLALSAVAIVFVACVLWGGSSVP